MAKNYSDNYLLDLLLSGDDTLFQLAASELFERGRLSQDDYVKLALDRGFEYDSSGKLVKTNHQKLGKFIDVSKNTILALTSIFGSAALSDALSRNNIDTSSGSSDTTPVKYGGTGFNPQTVVGSGQTFSPDNSFSWLSNLFGNIFGEKGTFSSMLTGLGSQFASSLLNKQNMIDLIDYQNQYNTPSAQMQRFKDAGLNPNLVYGLGSNGNQPSAGSVAPVDFDTSQRENRMAMMQFDLASKQAEADIAQKMSAVHLNNANASEVEERRIAQANQNSLFEIARQSAVNELNIQAQQLRSAMAHAESDEARATYAHELANIEKSIAEMEEESMSIDLGFKRNQQDTYWIDYLFDKLSQILGGVGSLRFPRTNISNVTNRSTNEYYQERNYNINNPSN